VMMTVMGDDRMRPVADEVKRCLERVIAAM
jgi:hypothetical protein